MTQNGPRAADQFSAARWSIRFDVQEETEPVLQ